MRTILERGWLAVILAVISSFVGSVALFVWSSIQMGKTVYHMFHSFATGESVSATVHMVAILDGFLLAVILYIFAVALYELFIGELKMPEWLNINNLDDLKKKLSSVIALMLAVTFLEHIAEWKDAKDTLMFAVSIALVLVALVYYMKAKEKDSHHE
ncbi:MAG: YqhA family protein [Deltaproteobacteria bacterium]|nr:YqhA family protein [Deltaproteobacteria bacterium]